MNKIPAILAVSGWLLAVGASSAADLQAAIQAIRNNDHVTAVAELKPLAAQGNAEAQELLGSEYQFGEGVPQDPAQAFAWMRKSADQGYVYAQYQLGNLYSEGAVATQDPAQAAHWYGLAAAQGDPRAQTNLGTLYEKGRGVALDHAQSAALFRSGAAGGDPVACFDLAVMYSQGGGVPKDMIAAYALIGMALAQYDINQQHLKSDAPHSLAQAAQWADVSSQKDVLAARDKVARVLTPAQVDLARVLIQQMARDGIAKALDARYPPK